MMTFRGLCLPFLAFKAETFSLSSMLSDFLSFCPLLWHYVISVNLLWGFPLTTEKENKPTSDPEWSLLVKEAGLSPSGWGSGLVQTTGVAGRNSHQPLLLLGQGRGRSFCFLKCIFPPWKKPNGHVHIIPAFLQMLKESISICFSSEYQTSRLCSRKFFLFLFLDRHSMFAFPPPHSGFHTYVWQSLSLRMTKSPDLRGNLPCGTTN